MGLLSKKKNARVYFITGTDTGVGKTLVCTGLLQAANQAQYSTVAVKPVAAGCRETAEGLVNDDALALQRNMSVQLDYETINPVALVPAIAPHIAAARAERELDAVKLAQHCREQGAGADFLLIEGAGGWRVPLNAQQYMSDIAKQLQAPVILVVAMRLGCLNHALLTAQAIRDDGLSLAAWVANSVEPQNMSELGDNLLALRDRIEAPLLGYLPYFEEIDPVRIAPYLEISYL